MQKEVHRQFIHFLGGTLAIALVIASTLLHFDKSILVAILIALFIIAYLLARKIQHGPNNHPLYALIKHVERDTETNELPGKPAFLLLAGTILTIAFFEPLPAIAGLSVLTFGDTVSTLIGKYRGKIELVTNRTLEGTLAGIIVGCIPLLFVFSPAKAIGIATVAMLAEYLPLDDNIGIPIVGALAASLLI